MKKTIYSLIMAFLTLSCTEDVVNVTPSSDSVSTLKFENTDQIFNYFNSSINKQDFSASRTSLQKGSDFKSFKEVYHTAMEELDKVETLEQHNAFLRKYSDVLTLVDSTYVPRITNPFYQAICNRDGIYESEGYAHKIIDSDNMVITESENINTLKKVKSISNLNSEILTVVNYSGATTEFEQGRLMENCGDTVEKNYFNNNRRCRDDRKVYVRGFTSFIWSGAQKFTPHAIAEAYGMIRNGWCNWKTYKTSLATRDCSFTVTVTLNGQDTDYSRNFFDQSTTSDAYNIILHQGALISNPLYWPLGTPPSIQFTQVNLEATSRGVGNNWVEFNCQ